MWTTFSIQPDVDDVVTATTDQDGFVSVTIGPWAGGGSASIVFSAMGFGDTIVNGAASIDKIVAALQDCRTELLRRAAKLPVTPEAAGTLVGRVPNYPVDHLEGE